MIIQLHTLVWISIVYVGVSAAAAGCGSQEDDDRLDRELVRDGGRTGPESHGDAATARADAAAGPDAGNPIGHVIAEPDDDATYVFDQDELRTYNLVIDPADLALIDMDPAAETYVTGILEFEGKTYGPIGIRYKGSIGAFLPPCTASRSFVTSGSRGPRTGKCSLKLDFDRVDLEARFHGLKKLNLHSMNIDPSLMRDRLGYALFREFGIAAPRAVHARVLVNGELRGVFIAVEQIDGRFTKSRFGEGGDGNVYKEVWPTSLTPDGYQAAIATNQDGNPSVQNMVDFANALANGDDASAWVDTEYMFQYIAVDRVIVNDDGPMHLYCGYSHNFYWYEAEHAKRFWLVPWDLDASFQLGEQGITHVEPAWNAPATSCSCGGGFGGLPTACDPLWGQFAARTDEYERTVDEFLAGPYAKEKVDAKLMAWSAQIDAAVQEASGRDGAQTYEEWQAAFATFLEHVETAREHRGYPYGGQ